MNGGRSYKYESDTIDVAHIQRFIQDGGGSADCWRAVFDYLRRVIPLQKEDWFATPEVRSFLEQNVDKNPYIPKTYSELHRLPQKGGESFISQWEKHFPVEKLSVDTEHFVRTVEGSSVMRKTSTKLAKTHSEATYFCKCLEWYLSYIHCAQNQRNSLVDIGASTPTAATFFNEVLSLERIYLVDLDYRGPKGNIRMVGTDARNLSYFEDDSIDFVCMHNAIEHFAGDSDSGVITECSRILKPGAKVYISPFNFSGQYTIAVNPIVFFYLRPDRYLHKQLESELSSGCSFRFHYGMSSHFARNYDWSSFDRRIVPFLSGLLPRLRPVEFDLQDERYGLVNGLVLRRDILKERNFHLLELTKQ